MSSTIGKPRVNFASIKNPLPYPDFLEVQLKSFQDFLQLDTPPEKEKTKGFSRYSPRISPLLIRAITLSSNFWTIISIRRDIRLKNVSKEG